MIWMFVLSSYISIANIIFKDAVSEVVVRRSINEMTSTATIELPKSLKFPDQTTNVSDRLKRGDRVAIQLGYDGDNQTEFTGYVRSLDLSIPIVLQCEDEMYQLKKRVLNPKSWAKATLKDVVSYVCSGYEVIYTDENINLGSFQIGNDVSAAQVLAEIKRSYGLTFFFKGKVLYSGFPFDLVPSTTNYVYDFQKNVAENQLEYKTADDNKLKVKAISHLPDGKVLTVWIPSQDAEGDIRTLNFSELNESELKVYAQQELKRFNYHGYAGTVTGFGQPFLHEGDSVTLRDNLFPERKGKYLIDAIEVVFGKQGFRRICTIGRKL